MLFTEVLLYNYVVHFARRLVAVCVVLVATVANVHGTIFSVGHAGYVGRDGMCVEACLYLCLCVKAQASSHRALKGP